MTLQTGEMLTFQQSINELSASIDRNLELLAKQREEIASLKEHIITLQNAIISAIPSVEEADEFNKPSMKLGPMLRNLVDRSRDEVTL